MKYIYQSILLLALSIFATSCGSEILGGDIEDGSPERGNFIYESNVDYFAKPNDTTPIHSQKFEGFIEYQPSNRRIVVHPYDSFTWSFIVADSIRNGEKVLWKIPSDQNITINDDTFTLDGILMEEYNNEEYHLVVKGDSLSFKYRSYVIDRDREVQVTKSHFKSLRF
ncbi:hypothetical protein [Flammeovirga pacifica]|uniref:Uncharacterized protein n=1 Tax=Flammeovirga pacifica TaxID=915059 RepID=A0A1S1Z4X5_FLAPC|nr:hypothetical protein [Flammeovirga pacifica]OHX68344.1 hypothetical protein NH26_19320 [Flammeovirga pacifica]